MADTLGLTPEKWERHSEYLADSLTEAILSRGFFLGGGLAIVAADFTSVAEKSIGGLMIVGAIAFGYYQEVRGDTDR